MIYKKLSLSVLLFATGFLTASAQKSPQDMERFIDVLMNKMTLEEKIGQLNLPVTGEITTGQAKSSDIAAKIKKGEVGGLFNLKGVEKYVKYRNRLWKIPVWVFRYYSGWTLFTDMKQCSLSRSVCLAPGT